MRYVASALIAGLAAYVLLGDVGTPPVLADDPQPGDIDWGASLRIWVSVAAAALGTSFPKLYALARAAFGDALQVSTFSAASTILDRMSPDDAAEYIRHVHAMRALEVQS